ncbi:MAG: Bcr/CflA family drug resistance efflux transporter, partial [Alcanivorax sp.]
MTGPMPERGEASVLSLETAREFSGNLLILLAGLAAIGTLSTNIILPSFASMASDIGVPARELGLLLSSFFAAFAVGQLLVGPLSDRYGRRPLVVLGLLVFIAGSLWCSRADNMNELILGRVIQALGVCAASVLSRAIARDLFDGEVLARALALTMVAMAAAPGFSPLLGGALEQALGWRANFLVVAVLGAILIPLYLSGAGETLPPSRRGHKALA